MEQRNHAGIPASLVNGRLEGINVPDLLWNVCRRRATGVLQLSFRGITKKVYVEEGRIIFAASGDPNDRLGELLLREGVVTLDQLEAAISQLSSGKRLGAILVEAGHLSPDNLVRGVLAQVKGIVLSIFPWEEGEYAFHEGPLPTEEVVTLGMRTTEILLQGIRQIRSFTRIRKSVGPPSTRFVLHRDWKSVLEGLEIRDGERMLVQRIAESGDRGSTIDGLCREIFLSNYEIYQALWAFRVLGIIHEGDLDRRGAENVHEGRLDRASVPEILVRLCRHEETGVLHLTRGTLERTFHIKEGLCVFATSNAIDDGLVAHLLRRGVISLRDREETARRLLSNKRVGTILLEMGVIDDGDLRATVREQLSEIVFDSFRWDQGDYVFIAGELPTIEEITLNRTVEDLVFSGVRRVTSWSRVREGCGGMGARLVLMPQYLAVLDKMTVGPEEWELISLLKLPKTVLEVCRESVLGDFRSCQILWALRLLGAVGEAPVEVSVDAMLGALDAKVAAAPREIVDGAGEEVPAAAIESEPEPIPVSQADETAEVITEPWRLAAERAPEDRPASTPAVLVSIETPAELALALSGGGDVGESVTEEPELAAGLPSFELGEPGTGLEDMKVDMPPSTRVPAFEVGPPEHDLEEAPLPVSTDDVELEPPREADVPPPEELTLAEADPEPEPDPEPDPDRTARLSPDLVESALREASAAAAAAIPAPAAEAAPVAFERASEPEPLEVPQPAGQAFEPPEGLDGEIASFNARHVLVFRALRAEVGAGAANVVRACRANLANGFSALFAASELRADGSFDPTALRQAVIEHRIHDAGGAFRTLLDQEMVLLRSHVGEKRAAALVEQIAAIP